MVIENLEVANFRNFESRKLAFSADNVFLTGPNGSGKSNLLESIGFLSLLRSFRTASPREMIRIGARSFQLQALIRTKFGREKLRISGDISGRRELFIGDAAVKRSSEFIREFHTVIFSPEDRNIAGGSSGHRRKFFDIMISTVEPEYMIRLSRYTRALLQRNHALKHAPQLAWTFDDELAQHAPFIAGRRRFYADAVCAEVNSLLNGKAQVGLIYRSDTPDDKEKFLEMLKNRKDSELRRCCTLSGIQLDEFEILFNGKQLRSFGSTGQIRLTTLLLKLAQFKLIRRGTQAPVAVLADDVTGELDADNLELFLKNIADADQSFFTFAKTPPFTLPNSEIIAVREFHD